MMAYYVSPYRRMAQMRKALDRMFDGHVTSSTDSQRGMVQIPLNVIASDEAYEILALVPGLDTEDVEIQVLEDTIAIRGELKAPDASEGKRLLNEIPAGEFQRVIQLPMQLDPDKAEAVIRNGVLRLRVPKAETARPRKIEVKVK